MHIIICKQKENCVMKIEKISLLVPQKLQKLVFKGEEEPKTQGEYSIHDENLSNRKK